MGKKSASADSPVTKSKRIRRIKIAAGISVFGIVIIGFLTYTLYYSTRVLPRVYAGAVLLSNKTLPEAVDALQSATEAVAEKQITLRLDTETLAIHPVDIGLVIDAKTTAANAYAYGRKNRLIDSTKDLGRALYTETRVPYVISYNQAKVDNLVAEFASRVDEPEVNAGVKIVEGKVVETQGIVGKRIDQATVARTVIERWRMGSLVDVLVVKHEVEPKILRGETKEIKLQAEKVRALKVTVTLDNNAATSKQATIDSWITSEINDSGNLQVTFVQEAVKSWLQKVSDQLNITAEEAKLTMENGQVRVLQVGREGKTLDVDKTATNIIIALRSYLDEGRKDKVLSVASAFTISKPAVTDQNIDSLGIQELIGTATTNFTGSPENRKHNISVGARVLNGILIRPGEEFSTLRYLGKIDGAAGYLPELVIKVDKTTPEFGGGLCQVSTTLFRSTMNAGLKVTQRRNHRYRVGYYEPPVGMDATIYEGSPDFKFVNDTSSNILIQSHIEGTKITFEIYGKQDGRRVELSTPTVYDVVQPPEPEYVQTDTLPEGTTKQTEKPHPGASASFTYTVINQDGSVRNKQTFNSKYVPWRARYLVGTKKADPAPEATPQ